ncbi:flavin reductase [Rhizobium rhizoryzae]|uniref:Flavin reductase n=1 Tax=Rhizobium rhizoryzae TaxID=451876 RepID=A0A7W6PUA5_9HYPH|nr:flavin reductase [Rhizobium rhizoryzae]MBB4145650.1 flavin reductase [Rhizobium rhizoryzae]
MDTLHEAVSTQTFRNAMSKLGAAVNIITTEGHAGRHGITASAVCSVTDTPPTVLVCVNRNSSAHDVIMSNGVLCVNVLGHGHETLARKFGQPGLSPDERFAQGSWTQSSTGAPVLVDAVVSLDCRIVERHEIGTHSVFYSRIETVTTAEVAQSLVYFDRAFHCLGQVQTSTSHL